MREDVEGAVQDVLLQPGFYPEIDPLDAILLEIDAVEDYEAYAESYEA